MTMMEPVVYSTRGRKLIFTPERMDQIRNLVERGQSREQIAEMIGCTVGTLQVTCSKLGVSLRRPRFNNLTDRVFTARPVIRAADDDRPKIVNGPPPSDQPAPPQQQLQQPQPPRQPQPRVEISLRLQYRGQRRDSKIDLPTDILVHLILEAEVRNLQLGELISQIIVSHVEKNRG